MTLPRSGVEMTTPRTPREHASTCPFRSLGEFPRVWWGRGEVKKMCGAKRKRSDEAIREQGMKAQTH
eukprot:768461-Hanusia_phi.AAC.6